MSTKDLIDSAVEHLHASASVKAVYGDPIVIEGKTIIPVAKVAYGFGGGTGTKTAGAEGMAPGEKAAGEGGGSGVAAKPVGVVEITGVETRFLPFGETKKLTIAAAMGSGLGLLFGVLLGRRR